MREFWDARAREDAFYFVDNTLAYGEPDLERFWAGGVEAVEVMHETLGVEVASGVEIVEIGCGVGRITRVLAERAARVRAIDVSEQMLEQARALNPQLENVEWLLGDGHTLEPIETGSVDVCHSHVVFQHIPDPEITLGYVREMGRVLRRGGWAAFQISDRPELHRRPPRLVRLRARLAAAAGLGPRGQDDPAWLGSAVGLERLRSAAPGAGLEVERVAGAGTQFCFVLLRRR